MKWFRMYWSLVDSVQVGTIDDGAFRTYIQLQCLAGQLRDAGKTGVDQASIDWRLRRNAIVTMPPLLDRYLVTIADGQYVIPDWENRQLKDDSSERVREFRQRKSLKVKDGNDGVTPKALPGNAGEERRGEENTTLVPDADASAPPIADCPHELLVALYHETLPVNPRVVEWTDARKSHMRGRWRTWAAAGKYATRADGLAFWRRYFEHVKKSAFLTGQSPGRDNKAPFIADLEWLVKTANVAKIIEGKYHEAAK